jgi:hypothetical protein
MKQKNRRRIHMETSRKVEDAKPNLTLSGSRPMTKLEDDAIEGAEGLVKKVRSASTDLMNNSVTFAKKYPASTAAGAIGVAAIGGYIAGRLMSKK